MTDKKLNFAEAFAELREINDWFHEGSPDLDQGLEKLKKGQELIKQCKARLVEVENEFKEIKDEYGVENQPTHAIEHQNIEEEADPLTTEEIADDIPF